MNEVRQAIVEITQQSETDDSDDEDDGLAAMLCEDTTDEDDNMTRPTKKSKRAFVARKKFVEDFTSTTNNCILCSAFGKNEEWWFRCSVCDYWAHETCTDAYRPESYVCDHCK